MLRLFENHFDTRSHVRSRNDAWTNEEEEEEERTECVDDEDEDEDNVVRDTELEEDDLDRDDLLICGVYPNRESFA